MTDSANWMWRRTYSDDRLMDSWSLTIVLTVKQKGAYELPLTGYALKCHEILRGMTGEMRGENAASNDCNVPSGLNRSKRGQFTFVVLADYSSYLRAETQ
jgi:hypothetical protein